MTMNQSIENKRLISLDAFRGATITGMILVNSPGSHKYVFSQLQHAAWHGWNYADIIFPFFLFIVGVSMSFSLARRRERGTKHSQFLRQVLGRTIVLFGLGLFLNAFPTFDLDTLRIPGVLQRIALCFLFASLILMRCGVKAQAFWIAGLLLAYWLMMEFIPVPGIGAGVYLPGSNFAAYVDSLFLGGHMWSNTQTWDPEGIVSTLPAIASTLLGAMTGHWLRSSASWRQKTVGMLAAGTLLVLGGELLNVWLPINKNLWTSSFAILMAGLAMICFAGFYWVIDGQGYQRWAKPFVISGMNSIAAYFLSQMIGGTLELIRLTEVEGTSRSMRGSICRGLFRPLVSPETASLLYALCFVLLMYLVVWFMWKRRWFLRV
jgi:predicted acyltransferase